MRICTKVSIGNSPEKIRRALATNLDWLNTDTVDIYELHNPDSEVPIDESLVALMEQVDAGRVRVIGSSNFSGDQLREALEASAAEGYPRFEVTQPPYSLVDSGAQEDLFPVCRQEEVAVTTYSPLAAGFLAGNTPRTA